MYFFAKIIEKLMKVRAMTYLDKNNVIYNKQFGFRSGYSTSDAIFEFVLVRIFFRPKTVYRSGIFRYCE